MQGAGWMRNETGLPWQIVLGAVILAASLVPVWQIDLQHAPTETQIRFWTTALVAISLFATLRGISFFRWLLLVLLGTGIIVSAWAFVTAVTIEVESALITLAQIVGLGLFFTPDANAWFRNRKAKRPEAA